MFFATFAQYSPSSVCFFDAKIVKNDTKGNIYEVVAIFAEAPKKFESLLCQSGPFLLCFSQLSFFWLTNNLFDHACHLN